MQINSRAVGGHVSACANIANVGVRNQSMLHPDMCWIRAFQ